MLSISEFFKRVGGIQAREIAFRAAVQAAVKETVGIDVPIEKISFKSGTVVLKNISSSAKSDAFIKKETILDRVNALQSIHVVIDIQ
jgi:hypothetical protein